MKRLKDESHRDTACEGLSKRGRLADTISKNTKRKGTKLYCQWISTASSKHNNLENCLFETESSYVASPASVSRILAYPGRESEFLWFYVLMNATGPSYKLSSSPRRAARLPSRGLWKRVASKDLTFQNRLERRK